MALDAANLAAAEATLRGEAPAPDPIVHLMRALFAAAEEDPVVARRLARFGMLLDPPGLLLADPEVRQRVATLAARLDPARRRRPCPAPASSSSCGPEGVGPTSHERVGDARNCQVGRRGR